MTYNKQLKNIAQLRGLKDEWEEVFLDTACHSPFLSFEYIEHWYNCFATPDQIRIYQATDQGRTIGFLPLVIQPHYGIRLLSSLTNSHCLLSEPLVRRGYEAQFPELILKEFLQDDRSWDMFRYSFSYSFSRFPGLFPDHILDQSVNGWRRTVQPNYQIRFNNTFDEYFHRDLSVKSRKSIKGSRCRLAKAGPAYFRHYQNEEALQWWPEFLRIEDSGWKGGAASSIARLDSDYSSYYDGLVKLLSANGALHLYFLELEGTNIAGVFGYVQDDIFHWAKTGYDEKYHHLSPSNLLLLDIIEDLIADYPDIKLFNMFPWDYGYKHKFSNEDSLCYETTIFNRTLRGQLLRLRSITKAALTRLQAKLYPIKT